MSRFLAEYVDARGILRHETVDAPSRADALLRVSDKRWALRRLQGDEPDETGVGRAAHLASDLARLVRLGVPLAPALEAVARSGGEGLDAAAARAAEGASLADALASSGGPLASPAFLALIAAAESLEALGHALGAVASLATRVELARRRLRAALAYPTAIAVLGIVFAAAFVTIGGEPSRALIPYLESCNRAPPLFVLATAWASESLLLTWGAAALALGLLAFVRRAVLAGRIPLVGASLGRRLRSAVALRALGSLVAQGVALPRAWQVAAATIDLGSLATEGADVARVLRESGLVTRAESLGIEAAARASQGELGRALEEAASDREVALERAITRLTRAIGPALEVAFGILIVMAALACLPVTAGMG